MKHVITITGLPGSGKSSTADEVARILGYKRFSSGDFWRKEIAQKQGLSIEELNFRAEKDPSLDTLLDEAVKHAGEKEHIVIDSRLAFHWIPDAFKVFLRIDPHTAAERAYAHIVTNGRVTQTADSVDDLYQKTLKRVDSERLRYKKLYDVDYMDESQYDFVIDTTKYPLKKVASIVVGIYKQWLRG